VARGCAILYDGVIESYVSDGALTNCQPDRQLVAHMRRFVEDQLAGHPHYFAKLLPEVQIPRFLWIVA